MYTALAVAERVTFVNSGASREVVPTDATVNLHLYSAAFGLSVATNGLATASIVYKYW
jgi:hypothetical protein